MPELTRIIVADQSDIFLHGLEAKLSKFTYLQLVATFQKLEDLLYYLKYSDTNLMLHYLFLGDLWFQSDLASPDMKENSLVNSSPRYLLDSVHEIAVFCRNLNMKIIMFGLADGWMLYQLLTNYRIIAGYLHKTDNLLNALDELIHMVAVGDRTYYLSPTAGKMYFETMKNKNDSLSFDWRDQILLESLASGVSLQTTCRLLDISERTYHRSMESIRKKLNAKTNAHLVAQAFRMGLLRFGDRGEFDE